MSRSSTPWFFAAAMMPLRIVAAADRAPATEAFETLTPSVIRTTSGTAVALPLAVTEIVCAAIAGVGSVAAIVGVGRRVSAITAVAATRTDPVAIAPRVRVNGGMSVVLVLG